MICCGGCDKPILDRFLLSVLDRAWHASCVRCAECSCHLTERCFTREGKLFCRDDFFRRYGTKCAGCCQGISPSDLVRRAQGKVFHLRCFRCVVCRKQLSTGQQLYAMGDDTFICVEDYNKRQGSRRRGSEASSVSSEDDYDDDGTEKKFAHADGSADANSVSVGSSSPQSLDLLSNEDSPGDFSASNGKDGVPKHSACGPPDKQKFEEKSESPASNEDRKDVEMNGKRRGPRTTIKAKQLEVLKAAFAATPKPTRHIREQLAKDTGLNMRVIQVWFQNRRSKERRMKQLTAFHVRRSFCRHPRKPARPGEGFARFPLFPGGAAGSPEERPELFDKCRFYPRPLADEVPSEELVFCNPSCYDTFFGGGPVDKCPPFPPDLNPELPFGHPGSGAGGFPPQSEAATLGARFPPHDLKRKSFPPTLGVGYPPQSKKALCGDSGLGDAGPTCNQRCA